MKPRSREALLETRVSALADCSLSLRCYPGCERPGSVELRPLVNQYGHLQLRALLSKLKCSGCKRRPAEVTIFDHVFDYLPESFRVQLVP